MSQNLKATLVLPLLVGVLMLPLLAFNPPGGGQQGGGQPQGGGQQPGGGPVPVEDPCEDFDCALAYTELIRIWIDRNNAYHNWLAAVDAWTDLGCYEPDADEGACTAADIDIDAADEMYGEINAEYQRQIEEYEECCGEWPFD